MAKRYPVSKKNKQKNQQIKIPKQKPTMKELYTEKHRTSGLQGA